MLFLSMLGLRCYPGFSLAAASGGYSVALVCRLLTAVTSLVADHRLQGAWALLIVARDSAVAGPPRLYGTGSISCDTQDQLLPGILHLPRPGIKPVSPALAGRFFTTEPPGKPKSDFKNNFSYKFAISRIKVQNLYYRKKLNSV